MDDQQSTDGYDDMPDDATRQPVRAASEHPVRGWSDAVVVHEPGTGTDARGAQHPERTSRTPPVIEVEGLGQVHPSGAAPTGSPYGQRAAQTQPYGHPTAQAQPYGDPTAQARHDPWAHVAPFPSAAAPKAAPMAQPVDPGRAPGHAQPYGAVQPYAPPVQAPVAGYQPYPGPPPMHTVVVVQQPKSVGISLVLTFFFGPLGMLYSTLTGFIVMLLINLVVLPLTLGFGALLTWPACMIWGAVAASNHNTRIAAATQYAPQGVPMQQQYPPQ